MTARMVRAEILQLRADNERLKAEVARLREALAIVRDVLDARPSEGLSFASALGLRSIVDHALSAGEPM